MGAEHIPKPEVIVNLLNDLLGLAVTVKSGPPLDTSPSASLLIGAFAAPDKTVRLLCLSDYNLAAQAGAALSMIPAGVAKDSAKSGVLPDNIFDNFREVLNVMNGALNRARTVRLALHNVFLSAKDAPQEVAAIMAKPTARLDLEIAIAGYGSGRLALLSGE